MRYPLPAVPIALALTAAPLAAQRPVTPYEVYEACRHPAAFAADSFRTRGGVSPAWAGVAVPSGQDPKLSYLCTRVNLRTPGMNWRTAARQWAGDAAGGRIPRTSEIIAYADGADRALFDWVARSSEVGAGVGAQHLALPLLPFRTNSAEVAAEDSATVRRIAEMLREHLVRNPGDVVTILGQADPTGSGNLELAKNRAQNLLLALARYDDGTFARNADRLRTAAHVVPQGTIERRVDAAVEAAVAGAVARAEAEVGARAGELLKARAPGFLVSAGAGAPGPRLDRGDQLLSAVAAPSSGSASRSGSIAIAVVDVVGEAAAEQVQIFLVEEVTRNICGRGDERGDDARVAQFRRLLPGTCALFGNAATSQLFRPTVGALRSAVRQDIDGMMPKLLSQAVSPQFEIPAAKHQAEAVFAVALAQYLTAVATGEDALQAAARVHGRLPILIPAAHWALVRKTDMAIVLRQAAPFLGLYRDARARVRSGAEGEALRDEVAAIALRAMLVNAGDAQVEREVWGADRAEDLVRVLESVPALLDAVRQLEAAYTAYRAASNASTEQRLALAADVVGGSADLFMALFPEAVGTARAESLHRLVDPAREMTMALTKRDFRAALVNGLVLARNVVPPAQGTPGADCRLANGLYCPGAVQLLPEQMRLATFAADFANAADQNGMNEALRNFVSQGGGYRSKRNGAPRSFVSVNAYLGFSGAHEVGYRDDASANNQAAFYLPVGLEVGYRTGWPALPSASVFFQLVDLGSVAAARYRDDDSVTTPDPELFDVLSPGALAVFSVLHTPLSVGLGASVAPRAQVVQDGGRDRISGAVRFSAFLAVDVPLFP